VKIALQARHCSCSSFMKKIYSSFILLLFLVQFTTAQTKILFDATKAETAGNADWVIDSDVFNLGFSSGPATVGGGDESNPQRFPTPAATLGQTYTETYWKGALSYWGLDCVQKGYSVETLPVGGSITYGNASNPQDLLNYKAFIICEPNIQFTAAEKTAILNFVAGGGGLFMISDHDVSDRNNDGWDSPQIWDDLMQVNSTGNTNPFGMIFNRSTTTSLDNFSETSTNVNPALSPTDSILHGPMGNVAKVLWSNGTSMTLSPAANPTVRAVIYKTSVSPATGNAGVMVAYAHYGKGKVIAIGDSSPCDDGTGDPNDNLFTGYMGDVPPNHRNLLMNGTIWLVTTLSVVPVQLVSFTATEIPGAEKLDWITQNESDISGYQLQRSENGTDFYDIGAPYPAQNNASQNMYSFTDDHLPGSAWVYYRVKMTELNGNIRFSDIKTANLRVTAPAIKLQNNPVFTEAVLNVNSVAASQLNVQVFNMQGRLINTHLFNLVKGKQDCHIGLISLSPGIYLLKCTRSYFSATLRVIKSE
jgi:hypothetical protein